uniref:Uncharacterized protein n=1 Tax=Brassica oleracea var. oleracea TaxID=109376 RepID=A0A0D3B1J2_BRAOL
WNVLLLIKQQKTTDHASPIALKSAAQMSVANIIADRFPQTSLTTGTKQYCHKKVTTLPA